MHQQDWHLHSSCSDGVLSPKELIGECGKAGLVVVSLTDHDTTAGLKEAAVEAKKLGLCFIPGVEISAELSGERIHILGYYIDPENQRLTKGLAGVQKQRVCRAYKIAEKLRELGFEINPEQFEGIEAVGRPHIARAVLENPANKAKLAVIKTASEFVQNFLLPGKPAFVNKKRMPAKQAIQLIHTAGGVAVWAHPAYNFSDFGRIEELAIGLKNLGLDGLETEYFSYTKPQKRFLRGLAEKLCLLKTGGSDFHGGEHPVKTPGSY